MVFKNVEYNTMRRINNVKLWNVVKPLTQVCTIKFQNPAEAFQQSWTSQKFTWNPPWTRQRTKTQFWKTHDFEKHTILKTQTILKNTNNFEKHTYNFEKHRKQSQNSDGLFFPTHHTAKILLHQMFTSLERSRKTGGGEKFGSDEVVTGEVAATTKFEIG